MRKRTVAFLILAPVGAALAFGVFRMIQHDFAVAPAAGTEESTRMDRPERATRQNETKPRPAAGSVADEMSRIYQECREGSVTSEVIGRFAAHAAKLELRHLNGLLDELQAPGESREVAAPFLLLIYARWAQLEPLKAWQKVREEANDAKKQEDRDWAGQRLAAMLDAWAQNDAETALGAYLEVDRGTELLRGTGTDDWWAELAPFFETVAKSLGDKLPERLRGMADSQTHAAALGLWATIRFAAHADPAALGKTLVEESVQAAAGDARRAAEFRTTAEEPLIRAWFPEDPFAAMMWYSQGRGGDAVLAYLEQGYTSSDAWIEAPQVREFLFAVPLELRDQWIATWLTKTAGADLALLAGLTSPELRWKFLRQAAWPKVAEEQEGFEPWACEPAAVREAMKSLELTDAQRAEIEQILSVR